jgi:hypothetical protein
VNGWHRRYLRLRSVLRGSVMPWNSRYPWRHPLAWRVGIKYAWTMGNPYTPDYEQIRAALREKLAEHEHRWTLVPDSTGVTYACCKVCGSRISVG